MSFRCKLTDVELRRSCGVTGCMYWSKETKTHCTATMSDDSVSSSVISAAKGVSIKVIRKEQRDAPKRIQAIFLLAQYERWLNANKKIGPYVKEFDEVVQRYPFRYPGSTWTAQLLHAGVVVNNYKEFCKSKDVVLDIKLHELFNISENDLARLRRKGKTS